MQKFGWKRKIGGQVSKSASTAFEEESNVEADAEITSGEVDWLTLAPLRKKANIGLEDGIAKAQRLVREGSVLAASDRYWEAVKKWDEALQYTPCDGKIYEMKAQGSRLKQVVKNVNHDEFRDPDSALMEVGEVFPAVRCAIKAVEFAPTWWVAHQTHGRALLGLGEVRKAVKSFSRAVHLNPAEQELWEEDLQWAWSLLQKKQQLDEEKRSQQKKGGAIITPVVDPGDVSETEEIGDREVDIYRKPENFQTGNEAGNVQEGEGSGGNKRLPTNYVQMRDPEPP